MHYTFSAEDTEAIFSQTKEGKTYISPVIIDELNNEPLVHYGSPDAQHSWRLSGSAGI